MTSSVRWAWLLLGLGPASLLPKAVFPERGGEDFTSLPQLLLCLRLSSSIREVRRAARVSRAAPHPAQPPRASPG